MGHERSIDAAFSGRATVGDARPGSGRARPRTIRPVPGNQGPRRGGTGLVYQGGRRAAAEDRGPEDHPPRVRGERLIAVAVLPGGPRRRGALKHDNIVTIYQVGDEQGIPFLAMEFLRGKSLEEWLRPDRRASLAEALTIGKQIARGLGAAHDVGLIHRDIKPANLWLEAPHGRVKILDFGLARKTAGEFTELTQQGAMLGTPAFMSPEQRGAETVDPRTDLFSVGCVLYRMVTGRLPFQGNTILAVLSALAAETPPPARLLNPEVPPGFSALIARLLSKDAGSRPASASVLLDELIDIEREGKTSRSRPPGRISGTPGPCFGRRTRTPPSPPCRPMTSTSRPRQRTARSGPACSRPWSQWRCSSSSRSWHGGASAEGTGGPAETGGDSVEFGRRRTDRASGQRGADPSSAFDRPGPRQDGAIGRWPAAGSGPRAKSEGRISSSSPGSRLPRIASPWR